MRDALIGAAPLVTGSLFVAYAAIYQMHLLPLWDLIRSGRLGDVLGNADDCAKVSRFLAVVLPDLYHQQHDDALAVRPACLAAIGNIGCGAGW